MRGITILPGARFGRWTAIAEVRSRRRTKITVRCDCGTVRDVQKYSLIRGDSQSCGCYQAERRIEAHTTHGGSKTAEYRVWCHMIGRCYNRTDSAYEKYGGRGIEVSERWRESFNAFLVDMGDRPSSKHSIERKDNDGPYSPDNCVWATDAQQARNRRSTQWVILGGEKMTTTEAEKKLGLSRGCVYMRARRRRETNQQIIDRYVAERAA